MKNLVLHLSLITARSLASKEAVTNILKSIVDIKDFQPSLFGSVEPLRKKFDPNNILYKMDQLYSEKGDDCYLRYRNKVRGLVSVNTAKGFNHWSNGIDACFDYSTTHCHIRTLIALFEKLLPICQADFATITLAGGNPFFAYTNDNSKNIGEINGNSVPHARPMGIKLLNGVWWINVFGPEYIRFFGESVLRSLPAYRAEFIGDGRWFWLQPTAQPEAMFTEAGKKLAGEIKGLLGHPRAFAGHDPSVNSFLAKYETPPFDFSEIRTINREIK